MSEPTIWDALDGNLFWIEDCQCETNDNPCTSHKLIIDAIARGRLLESVCEVTRDELTVLECPYKAPEQRVESCRLIKDALAKLAAHAKGEGL